MPTRKPRVVVTLNPYVHGTIARLAELQGRSRGAVISDLLEGVHPPLMRTVALLDAARNAPRKVVDDLRDTLEGMEREMVGAAGSGLENMEWLSAEYRARTQAAEQAELREAERRRSAQPAGCTCTITKTERLGEAKCPFHSQRHRRGSTPT